ncbi:peroxynitrite isomerase THAP4-like [Liolophura sinensis]|uniref:peroxynitrite isomerase THAP4-like n=1 Tax=Liolophura sinensis TaxID=3198878 RepID=UPI003158C518
MSSSSSCEVAPQLQPLAWLLGKWRSDEGQAVYPTMKLFPYQEELEFFQTGQPNIQFNFNSCNPENKKPMHKETGFIRIDPTSNKVAFMFAMNIGLCSLEEGTVDGQCIVLQSKNVNRMSFGKEPETRKICRRFELKDGVLKQTVQMETSTTALQEHLSVTYRRVE